jgi:CheY-like chemotaxis protein
MRILVADDEEAIRSTLEMILKSSGFEVDFAANGEETLKKITSELYDLLLLDIVMPKIDGYVVLQQVRKIYPGLPVVFITAYGEAEKIEESIGQYKLTSVIEKPFTPREVLEVVDRAIRSKKVQD